MNGKEYLDFNFGQMCSALGHNHPRIVQALQEGCETLIHSHMSMFNDREIVLAARLAEITPDGMDRSPSIPNYRKPEGNLAQRDDPHGAAV